MDRLETIRAFLTVVDRASFSLAAERLGTSPQVVSKYVRALEAELDQQLLYRTTRRIALTEAGRAFLPRFRQLLEDFEELRAAAREEDRAPRGHLVVTAPVTFGERVLPVVIQRFLAAHPAVTLELKLSDRRINLVEEGVDVALRIGRLEDASLIVRRLGAVPIVCCAAPAYLARAGYPKQPEELRGHNCILDSNFRDQDHWRFRHGEKTIEVKVSGAITVNSADFAIRLALEGAGIVLAPAYVAAEAIADGRLTALFERMPDYDFGLYAAYLPSRHLAAKVRTFIDFICASGPNGKAAFNSAFV